VTENDTENMWLSSFLQSASQVQLHLLTYEQSNEDAIPFLEPTPFVQV
jgi:hypothetical protein